MKREELVTMLDLASVKMDTTIADIEEIIDFAIKENIPQICVNSANVPFAKKLLEEKHAENIMLIGTAAFPTGCFPTEIKTAEIQKCAEYGCREIDVCSNQGLLKSNLFDDFEADVAACIEAAHKAGMLVKIIVEAASVTPAQMKRSCEIVAGHGAEFYKTSSGYMENKTLPFHITLIKEVVGDRCQIKAANGVRTYQQLISLYDEGCTRFGVGLPFVRDILRDCDREG